VARIIVVGSDRRFCEAFAHALRHEGLIVGHTSKPPKSHADAHVLLVEPAGTSYLITYGERHEKLPPSGYWDVLPAVATLPSLAKLYNASRLRADVRVALERLGIEEDGNANRSD
jgi:hypothetical protein